VTPSMIYRQRLVGLDVAAAIKSGLQFTDDLALDYSKWLHGGQFIGLRSR
jgi:hypothetical protein